MTYGTSDTKSGSFGNGQIAVYCIDLVRAIYGCRSDDMINVGVLVRLEAKPGKEKELAAFLMQGLERSS
jgi:hypothetical protein